MTEVFFYHLERAALEDALPELLEKTLARGWKALVRAGSEERLATLDSRLWTYREEGFLAHGLARDAHPAEQPILLTSSDGNPNAAEVLFFVDGTAANDWAGGDVAAAARIVLIFDGRDAQALEAAREHWKQAKACGHEVTYFQQAAGGKWEKRS
ncbi:MAG: DNA polymerase III subunit chi [Alphaproteobacteria bacterium]|nr:DNA polymerase III subunit chi [Alphaproteobacteria bacterium]